MHTRNQGIFSYLYVYDYTYISVCVYKMLIRKVQFVNVRGKNRAQEEWMKWDRQDQSKFRALMLYIYEGVVSSIKTCSSDSMCT